MASAYEVISQRQDIALMLSTAACIGMALGLFPGLIALAVAARGFDTSWNGALAAMPAVAGILVGPFVPRLIAGSLRLFLLSTGLAALGACLFPYFSEISAWFLIRFAMGVGMGIQWVVSEAWMNRLAIGPRRGTILSFYVIVLSAAIALGPYMLSWIGSRGQAPFLTAALLLILSCLPLVFISSSGEAAHRSSTLSLRAAFLRKPSTMLTGLADGFIFQTLLVFLPLYFMRLGVAEASALAYLTLFCLGGVLLQFVVGYLLDRFTPALVLAACCALLVIGLVLASLVKDAPFLAGPLLVFTGGCAAAIYTAGLAGINDAFSAAEMPSGTSVFSMLWYIGGVSGPVAAGYAMDLWDPFGMAAVVAIACASVIAMGMTILLRAR
ncbi:MAG TPA: MFS transporter [Nordella sp.]|nr:MFS transporter [Nordella sp.]